MEKESNPTGIRQWVIPDLHGCLLTLQVLLDKIAPNKEDKLFFLGDYINKGPNSYALIAFLMSLKTKGYRVSFLMGNHEYHLKRYFDNKAKRGEYKINDELKFEMANNHKRKVVLSFLDSLAPFIELENHFLVHAGFDFSVQNPFDDVNSMISIRNFKYSKTKAASKTIIHGHHPHLLSDIIKRVEKENKILPLDNGCVYHNKPGMGNLLAYSLLDRSITIVRNRENKGTN